LAQGLADCQTRWAARHEVEKYKNTKTENKQENKLCDASLMYGTLEYL
jgi:hypothetical protein